MSVFIERIKIKNLLSFDEEGIDFELKPLNVLIGANASGKSNFVAAIKILCSTFGIFNETLSEFGGVREVINKKIALSVDELKVASIEANLRFRFETFSPYYKIAFSAPPDFLNQANIHHEMLVNHNVELKNEMVVFSRNLAELSYRSQSLNENSRKFTETMSKMIIGDHGSAFEHREYQNNEVSLAVIRAFDDIMHGGLYLVLNPEKIKRIANSNSTQVWVRNDLSNAINVLSRFDKSGHFDENILPRLKEIYPQLIGIRIHLLEGGGVTATIREKGMEPIAWSRGSDGLVRLSAILTILTNPYPPKLICLEEPENGFHPEVIPVIAKALKEASERTQIIITTHSAELLSYLDPEDIVTCERSEQGGTQLRRLEKERLSEWLDDYSLGDLWLKGVLGGTRY